MTERQDITKGYYSAHENRFKRSETTLVKANDPDIYDVKFDKFAGRSQNMLFNLPSQTPIPIEGRNVKHGGLFYNVENQSRFKF